MGRPRARLAARRRAERALCAGGTLASAQLSRLARGCGSPSRWRSSISARRLLVEPAVHDYAVPVFIALLPVLAIVLVFLLVDPTFSLRRELSRGFGLAHARLDPGRVRRRRRRASPTGSRTITPTGSSSSRASAPTPTGASCCSIR